jgi:hypothetical protein
VVRLAPFLYPSHIACLVHNFCSPRRNSAHQSAIVAGFLIVFLCVCSGEKGGHGTG